MDENLLTIQEVAKYLGVSERTVSDWIQKGELPAKKNGSTWSFVKSEIESWADKRFGDGANVNEQATEIPVATILSPQRIIYLNHPDKATALRELSANLATAPQVQDAQELEHEILYREELMSTAIGRGIAIPHVRLHSVSDLVISIGISRCDIVDFSSLDDIPVRILFMIAANYRQHSFYLQTLSFFSSRLKSGELGDAILKTTSADEVYKLILSQTVSQ